MKTTFKRIAVVLFVFAFAAAGVFAQTKTMYVCKNNVVLKNSASSLSKTICSVPYAQEVEVLQEKGSWIKVSVPSRKKKGWIKKSQLTKKHLSSVARIVSDADEISLAGKGSQNTLETTNKAFEDKLGINSESEEETSSDEK